jgi:hypothetical protein
MIAYRKFSDVLQNEGRAASSPKPAKAPKAEPIDRPQRKTLEELGALGGVVGETENPRAPAETAPALWEAEAERTAILEHDSGIPRNWAEGFARLDPDRPPGDVPPSRWSGLVDDVKLFLDSPFCAVAAALGWGPHDLFGCDRDRPFARIDQAGLLWLLHGDRLIAMTENTATIETPTGARQIWRRKPAELGLVLAWELA